MSNPTSHAFTWDTASGILFFHFIFGTSQQENLLDRYDRHHFVSLRNNFPNLSACNFLLCCTTSKKPKVCAYITWLFNPYQCTTISLFHYSTILNPSLTVDQDKPTSVNQTPRAMNGRKRILVNELRRTIEWLETDSNYELSKEFELIKSMSSDKASCSVAKLPENQAKNRYCDILPCKVFFFFSSRKHMTSSFSF